VDYYDPYGTAPSKRVEELLEKVGRRVGARVRSGARFVLRVSKAMHQTDLVSCGLYSLAFLYERIKRKQFNACTVYRAMSSRLLDTYTRFLFLEEYP
jgi:hypothetical protein